ncbi:MAG: CBS domain-containing protein [Planctomycetes bacterium]|nr:CBS domain-containing protein [Planctomycetota bacterium]
MNGAALGNAALLGMVPGPGLLFGLMLLAAIVGGYAARFVHVPRVIGFLVGGIGLRVVLRILLDPLEGSAEALATAAAPLGAVNDLALGMILFAIGGVFERSRLRAIGPQVRRIGLTEIALTVGFVFAGTAGAALLAQSGFGLGPNLVLAVLLAAAAIATAPAATLFVLREYDAKGPITDTILGLVGFNNIACILVFQGAFLLLAATGAIETPAVFTQNLWLSLLATTIGSVVIGLFCGTLLSIVHGKLALAETSLIFFAMFIVLGAGEKWLLTYVGLSFNFLLTALTVGAVFCNVAIDAEKLNEALRSVGAPIFAGFFVMAGYSLHLEEMVHLGWVGGAYVVCRTLAKVLGGRIGVRWARQQERVGVQVGSTLLCQAAVVIGLAAYVQQNWHHELAARFGTVILGSIVVFELVGPLLIKRCVVRGGEVKAITLLRRQGPAAEGASVFRLTLQSLLGLIGLRRERGADHPEKMQVQHIMRRNVAFLPEAATLDEVLHFIERSRYSHFPVVHEDGKLTGVIHFSDVRDVIYEPALRELVTAADLADTDTPLVPMDMPLPELLEVFTRQNVGVLPVGDTAADRHVVGVVEQRDLLRALHLSRIDND